MKFGFHIDHPTLGDRLSAHKRIYSLLFLLFFVAISATFLRGTQIRVWTYADTTLAPVPENYSAPMGNRDDKIKRKNRKIIGFLPSWNVNSAHVYPEYLDQIIYSGLAINKDGVILKKDVTQDSYGTPLVEWSHFISPEFNDLRARAQETNTKIILSLKNFDNESIDTLISNPTATDRAVREIVDIITTQKLDGIDINFEYFTASSFPTMKYLNQFMTTLRREVKSAHPKAIISMDVNATVIYNDNAYDMVKLGELVDQIIIMGYDYNRPSSTIAGPIAPLYENGDTPSVSRSVYSLLGRVPREKIILGIPLYGYEWQTETKEYGSPTIPDTGATATYKRVRELIENRNDIKIGYGEITHSPYITYTQNGLIKQIHYEDEKSLLEKINFVHEKDIAGIAFWALGYEGTYLEPWYLVKENMKN